MPEVLAPRVPEVPEVPEVASGAGAAVLRRSLKALAAQAARAARAAPVAAGGGVGSEPAAEPLRAEERGVLVRVLTSVSAALDRASALGVYERRERHALAVVFDLRAGDSAVA